MNNINNNNNINNRNINYPFKIMTQNIQGLNSETKQHQIIDMMNISKIDILGLSETKLNKNNI